MIQAQNKLLIAAMPSSGSDWFADCLLKSSAQLVTHATAKEPLNPICNLDHFDVLAKVFGCEAEPAIASIAASPSQSQVDEVLPIALGPQVNFIKEVWVGYQLPQLQQHFHTITLTRSYDNTFPPSRVRVYSWYLALARSIELNLELNHHANLSKMFRYRVVTAHRMYQKLLQQHSNHLAWEHLMEADIFQLQATFRSLQLDRFADVEQLASIITTTRQQRKI